VGQGPGYWNDLDMLMVGYKQLKEWENPQTFQECPLRRPILFWPLIRFVLEFCTVLSAVHGSGFPVQVPLPDVALRW
jgi:hypothetical protein